MPIQTKVLVGRQANKVVLTGMFPWSGYIDMLNNGAIQINPEAQRSLVKGANKQTTMELLNDDKAHRTPRMREIVSFYEHLIRLSDERHPCGEGFLGAVQMVVPESFTEARLLFPNEEDTDLDKGIRLAKFVLRPGRDEAAFHLGDGQGRLVGFHSLARVAKQHIDDLEKDLRKAQRNGEDTTELQERLDRAKGFRRKVNDVLSKNHLTFVCYAADVAGDGTVKGLDTNAEKRLYIEGNALNSQATKEEVVKYEAYSPVIMELVKLRYDVRFMAPEYIEEDSKSIGLKSPKLFTLSALAKAYCLSIIRDEDPIKPSTHDDFGPVSGRAAFVRAYWEKINELFERRWTAPDLATQGRVDYLRDKREKKIVCFSAIFLEALGLLGYALGESCGWNPEPDLESLEVLAELEYDPTRQTRWRTLMMREAATPGTDGQAAYVFNNVKDSAPKVYQYLREQIGLSEAVGAPQD